MDIHDFFPIPVAYFKMDNDITEEQNKFISNERIYNSKQNALNIGSKHAYVLDEDIFKNIKDNIIQKVNEYFQKVFNPIEPVELYITNSWLNWTYDGQSHHSHYHPNSIISGVIYVSVEDYDSLTFENPNMEMLGNLRVNSSKEGKKSKWYSDTWTCPIKKKHVIMFPSTLRHNVETRPQAESKGARISIAFNTWFKGKFGHEYTSTELSLPSKN